MTDSPPSELAGSVKSGQCCAVITGDVVASSRLSADHRTHLLEAMKDGSQMIADAFHNVMPLPVDIYRGDGWQMLIADAASSLRIGLFYRAFLRSCEFGDERIDTRFAIAIGKVNLVPAQRVSEGDGPAFQLSGRMLASLDDRRMGFAGDPDILSPDEVRAWDACFAALDHLVMGNWSPARARAVSGAIRRWPEKQIADLWSPPIRQPSVNQNLRRAGWQTIQTVLEHFECGSSENT